MLETYREEFVAFRQTVAREEYLHFAGLKETIELEPVYERYAALFTPEAVAWLRAELDATSDLFPTQRYGIRLLISFAQRAFVERAVAPLTEEIAEVESALMLSVNGEDTPFHQSAVLLARESSGERRRNIYQERLRSIETVNPRRLQRLQRIHEGASTLGFSCYRQMLERQTGLEYERLCRELNSWMERSEGSYHARLGEALERDLRISPQYADRGDQPHFQQLVEYDEHFPSSGLRKAYEETLQGLGIRGEKQSNVAIDDEDRPRKHPRAFCSPIQIPEEIKLVIRPTGGQNDYQALMHEGGHAQHFAWTSPNLLPEFRYAGDNAVTECYAFLFNYLVTDPLWLADVVSFGLNYGFVERTRLHKLLYLRRYIGKMEYELRLHSQEPSEGSAEDYTRILTRATGFRYHPEEYLIDTDDGFYSADYLRAWAVEVLLREHLRTRFGRRWWRSRRAGDYLIDLWSTGQRYTVEELAKLAGLGDLSFDPLFMELLDA